MRFILTLFKRILSALGNIYTKDEVDTVLEPKLEVEELDEAVLGETEAMNEAHEGHVDSAGEWKARSEALANIAKWRTYASAMQSMVDAEMATMIAEEFEKATVEYLADPTKTKDWSVVKNTDGTITSSNPYYETPPTRPVVDFNVANSFGVNNFFGAFNDLTNVPIFLARSKNVSSIIQTNNAFNSPIIALEAVSAIQALYKSSKFNSVVVFPKVTNCSYMLHLAPSFNQPLSLPKVTNCSYMLNAATAFNSTLDLPKATSCSYMLYRAKVFNQPLSLPEATNCSYMLVEATSFNQSLDLPNATNCYALLMKATSFNQPLSLPLANDCTQLLSGATSFNQPLSLPLAKLCQNLLAYSSNFNHQFSLPSATNCIAMLYGASKFNQTVLLPMCSNALSAFYNTAMSAENISKTLDSLPTWTDGASHVITFTGSPGAAELTQESPSVAAAVAKGWTVEL